MLVPRSYKYSSSPPKEMYVDEKSGGRRAGRKSASTKPVNTFNDRPSSPVRTSTEPLKPMTKPVAVPQQPERTHSATAQTMPVRSRNIPSQTSRRSAGTHDPNALPPAVAALLAMTTIPPPRPNQFRRKSRDQRRMSIDELVSDWKSDDALKASYSSSPALSILLEDASDGEDTVAGSHDSTAGAGFLHSRSPSSESVPSLEADDRSVISMSNPRTPESLRSRKSSGNLKQARGRPAVTREESTLDHPLVPRPESEDDDLLLSASNSRSATPKPKPSFTSNLTTSLRALKKATIGSLASFSLSSATAPSQRVSGSRFSDDMLWSHPYLFPRMSSEARPTIEGIPTEAQRRYLNPLPLTFEEQETPFQLALHAPFLAEEVVEMPTIQMQTYGRGKRKASPKARGGPDPNSEAGRALLSASGVRQREPRENSDFLRVVVLEMNMRREGKLESGRARIWLPPRQSGLCPEEHATVPSRWVGVSAYA